MFATTKRTTLIVTALLALLLLPNLHRAVALESGGVGILPANPDSAVKYSDSWLIFNLKPGETKKDAVKVFNKSDVAAAVKLYPVDAVTTTDGSFAPLEESVERTGVGKWITIDQYRIDVPAHSEVIVPLTITIPEGVDVGDHAGAVIMENVAQSNATVGGAGMNIITRVGIRVFETVPGTITQRLAIQKLDWKFQDIPLSSNASKLQEVWYNVKRFIGLERTLVFNVHLENQGNVRLEPTGTVSVKNLWGKQVGVFDETKLSPQLTEFNLGLLFPGKSTVLPLTWSRPVSLFNHYRFTATATYGDKLHATTTANLWIIPYNLIAVLAIIAVLIILAVYLRSLLVTRATIAMPTHKIKRGETLEKIAAKYKLPWQKIAKVNELQPPSFSLKGLKDIKIPLDGSVFKYLQKAGAESMAGPRKKRVLITLGVLLSLAILSFAGTKLWHRTGSTGSNVNSKTGPAVSFSGLTAEQEKQQAETRDTQRKVDLGALRDALSKYFHDYKKYPFTGGAVMKMYEKDNVLLTELVGRGYLQKLPEDPRFPTFEYTYQSSGNAFTLSATLENKDDAAGQLVDGVTKYLLTGGK